MPWDETKLGPVIFFLIVVLSMITIGIAIAGGPGSWDHGHGQRNEDTFWWVGALTFLSPVREDGKPAKRRRRSLKLGPMDPTVLMVIIILHVKLRTIISDESSKKITRNTISESTSTFNLTLDHLTIIFELLISRTQPPPLTHPP